MAKTPKLVIPVEADIKKAAANLNSIKNTSQKSLTGINKLLQKSKQNFLAVGAGIAAAAFAFKKFIGVAGDFEQSIANVAAVSGGARKELSELARETGATTVFSAKEAADAMYFLASAGIAVTDMTFVLTPALNLASAAQIGVAEATDITINSLKIFGAEMEDAAKFTDIMAQTVRSANTDMPQLGEAIKVAGSTAKLAGVSFEDLNVLIAGMANQGIKGSEAGTKLRQSFARLLKPTAEAQKTLLKYNITQTDIANNIKEPIKLFKLLAPAMQNTADATEILGVRQLAVAGLIKNGIPDLIRLDKAMESAGGTAERMAKEQLDTLQGSLKLLQSAFQEVILSGAGEGGLLDIFKSIVNTLIDVVKAFQKVPGPLKAIVIGVGLLVPAFIALQAAMGPIGLAFVAIGAAMAVLLPQMVDFSSESDNLKTITDELTKIQEDYQKVLEALRDPTKKLTASAKALLEIRKEELEIQEKEKLQELIALRNKLSSRIDREAVAHEKNVEALKKSNVAIVRARKLEKLNRAGFNASREAKEKLIKAFNEENEVTKKQAKLSNIARLASHDVIKAKREHKEATDDLLKSSKKLNNFELIQTELVEKLAVAYINQRDNVEGLKISESDLFALGNKVSGLTKKRVAEIDRLAAAQKKLAAEQEKGGNVVIEKTLEEIAALRHLALQRHFLMQLSGQTEAEITSLTLSEINKRIEGYQKESEARWNELKKVDELVKSSFAVATSIFENFMQNRFDRTNEFQDKLDELDIKDRQRTKNNLLNEISELSKSDDAKDKALAQDKQRDLDRMNLEDKAAKREKEIKRDEALANRRLLVAQRKGAAFSIAVDTGKAIAKAAASAPFPFNVPGIAFATAKGALAATALFSKPIPPIPAFAKGGDFQTKGPMLAMLGDNPSGRENVNVTPLKSFQSTDNSRTSKSEINIGTIEVPANSPEELFGKIYDYAKDMGINIVKRG